MSPDVQPPMIERYGYSWVQHPDGLYYEPPYPGDNATLLDLEAEGILGHRSVQRGEYRDILRFPEEDEEPRADRFGWSDGDLGYHPVNPEEEDRWRRTADGSPRNRPLVGPAGADRAGSSPGPAARSAAGLVAHSPRPAPLGTAARRSASANGPRRTAVRPYSNSSASWNSRSARNNGLTRNAPGTRRLVPARPRFTGRPGGGWGCPRRTRHDHPGLRD